MCDCSDQALLLAVGLSVGLLSSVLLLILLMCCLRMRKNKQDEYQELISMVPSVPAHSAPVIPVSQSVCRSVTGRDSLKETQTNSFMKAVLSLFVCLKAR